MRVATADPACEQDIEDIARLAQQLSLTTTRSVLAWTRKYITQALLTPTMHSVVKLAMKRRRSKRDTTSE
jgi:hypothetical protein